MPSTLSTHAIVAGCLIVSAWSTRTSAQDITVQQPWLQTFSVGTTVVAPDRGGAYAGGVRRSAMSRARYGFLPWGSNIGLSTSSSGVTVHPWIHDLRGMDEALLNQKPGRRAQPVLSENAEHAFRTLQAQAVSRTTNSRDAVEAVPPSPPLESSAETRAVVPNPAPPRTARVAPAQVQALRNRAQHFAAQGNARLAEAYSRLADEAERRR